LAVDGFNMAHGLSIPNVEEAHLNRIMIEISKQVILVADTSKFHKRSFAFIALKSEVDVLITDSSIQLEDQKKLENIGIQVIVV
jgi:DeoR family transcriptional regulator of aga operon